MAIWKSAFLATKSRQLVRKGTRYLPISGNKLQGYGWEMHKKAIDVLAGKRIDPTFLPIIYGLKEADDWEDEANCYKANPSLGYTIQIERVWEHFQQAKRCGGGGSV